MSAVSEPQSSQVHDKLSEAYCLFLKLFLAKFLRASAIWWGFLIKEKGKGRGRSFADFVSDNPARAIKRLTRGKLRRFDALVVSKFESALMMWAVEKLGKDFEKYMNPALEDFFTSVFLQMGWPRHFLTAIHISPLYLPLRLRKRVDFPSESLYGWKREYETLLAIVRDIKNKTRRNPGAQKMALIEKLPGTDTNKANTYQGMKPSQIVLTHMARKYKMPLSGEGLKKYLTQRIPQDLIDREIHRFRKSLRHSLPQSA